MDPEVWVGIAAVFIAGGAIGSVGTLLAQWIVRKLGGEARRPPPRSLDAREVAFLRSELSELTFKVENLDVRLDFQEQLLGGATPTTQPPPRVTAPPLPLGEGAPPPDDP